MTNLAPTRVQGWAIMGLMVLALSLLGIMPAQATSLNYILTGDVRGDFTADLSVPTSGFVAWNLTTPIGVFTDTTGQVVSNMNLTLFQYLSPTQPPNDSFSFTVSSAPPNNYFGIYSAQLGGAGIVTGTYRAVPEASSLLLLGCGLVGLAWWARKQAA